MHIPQGAKHKLQLVLAIAIAVAAVRAGYILYQRQSSKSVPAAKAKLSLNADYYVIPKKLYPYDLKSARQLTQQPVWVKEGYRYSYYPFDLARRRSDFSHEAGTLLPLQRLQIKNVVTDASPGSPDQRQVMAVFEQNGKPYAFPIGAVKDGAYHIYSDEMMFIQDPKELYRHWPADMWNAIDRHEVKLGMNELQADFAIGMGIPESVGDVSAKTVRYPNGGHPVTITYRDGKAISITPGPAG